VSTPRVIAGKVKGFHLQDVPGDSTRPITDRVKGALFNILEGDILEARFLDLFGGTGAVGIEALSRGAKFARFIDNNRKAIETIKANLEHTGLKEKAEVFFIDAFAYLKKPIDREFDYIYIAPPQYKNLWIQALNEVDETPSRLSADGWVMVQINPIENQPVTLLNLVEFDQRKYGDTLLIFYRRISL
jgi:16S rRNA (guanine966-N2)-methyltransferase